MPFVSVGDMRLSVTGFARTNTFRMEVENLVIKLPSKLPLNDPNSWDVGPIDQTLIVEAGRGPGKMYALGKIIYNTPWENAMGISGLTLSDVSLEVKYTQKPFYARGVSFQGTATFQVKDLAISVGLRLGGATTAAPLSLPAVTLAHALTSLRLASLSRWTVPFKKKLLTDSGVYLRVQEVSLYQVMEVVLHLAGSSGSPPSWQWLHRVKFSFEGCMTTADYVEASAKRI